VSRQLSIEQPQLAALLACAVRRIEHDELLHELFNADLAQTMA
jgi:hypothetical protein